MASSKAGAAVEVEELPKAIVRRVVKDKLSQCSGDDGGGDLNLQKDTLLAFSESARIFIHYLSATANDVCKESKRQTINAEDVFKALEEIEFPEFIGPLKASLDDFRRKNAAKKGGTVKTSGGAKKRKVEKQAEQTENEVDVGEDMEEETNEDENGAPDDN
ncbi:Dna polymerase epsilon subunit [Thalictrum thalictroides]|uniref:Dna polymerase epsilon subunit n=1 Tax=Thalictrum thalictroides TaxID=46969 RepID=A0A7J6WV34_THATH|nr:Dna polymerase epsilon subunit [Thalictrum thalictroides]